MKVNSYFFNCTLQFQCITLNLQAPVKNEKEQLSFCVTLHYRFYHHQHGIAF